MYIITHTLLQHQEMTLYQIWWRASIPVPLVFLSHLVENPSIDRGTFRFFHHIWWRTKASIPVPLVFLFTSGGEPKNRSRHLSSFFSHLVENPSIDPGTSRLSFHIWWRTQESIPAPLVFFSTSGGEPKHRSRYLSIICFHI